MPSPITMPKYGMTMTEGTVVRWLAAEGDHIEKGQLLVEIETEKLVNELQAPASGTLTNIIFNDGATAPVSEIIGWILLEGESKNGITDRSDVQIEPFVSEEVGAAGPSKASTTVLKGTRGAISPKARHVADELGVDLATVTGTGPGGRVTKEDVLQAVQQQTTIENGYDSDAMEPLSAMRRAIIQRVTRSAEIPQIVLYSHADASALLKLRQQDKAIAFDDMIVWCIARTLVDHRYLNASFGNSGIRLHKKVNIGLVVSIDRGLVIPVIRDATRLSLREISTERKHLVDRVRSRQIIARDVRDSTFTLTNLGMYPIDRFEALLNPPGAAMLSIGRIQQVASPGDGGGVLFRPVVEFGLTLDHRIVDGAAGAAFLKDFIARIENIELEGA